MLTKRVYSHIDIADVQTAYGKHYPIVGIDRISKFAFTQFVERAAKTATAQLWRALIAAVPYWLHTVLTPISDSCFA